MRTRVMASSLAAVAMVGLSACSTVAVHVDAPQQLYPYKGTRTAGLGGVRAWQEPIIPGEAPVRAVLDVPLCLVADTVLLPIDLMVWLTQPEPAP